MAHNKTRKSSKGVAMQVAGLAAGVGVGAIGLPKLIAMVDKNGTLDPKIASGVGAAVAFFGASKTSGFTKDLLLGAAAGQVWNLVSDLVGLHGIGWDEFSGSTDLNRVAGGEYSRSREVGGQL